MALEANPGLAGREERVRLVFPGGMVVAPLSDATVDVASPGPGISDTGFGSERRVGSSCVEDGLTTAETFDPFARAINA